MSIGLNVYELNTVIPIVVSIRKNNGSGNNNKDIIVNAYDAETNQLLLDRIPVPLVSGIPGFYKYNWSINFTQPRRLFVEIGEKENNSGTRLDIIDTMYIYVDDFKQYLTDKIDENDGNAV